jgi:hypothetical protein
MSSKNQAGQTGIMETGRKELILMYRIIILSDQYCLPISAAILRRVWVGAEWDEFYTISETTGNYKMYWSYKITSL